MQHVYVVYKRIHEFSPSSLDWGD